MAEQNKPNEPNEASRKSKAEGERWSPESAGSERRPESGSASGEQGGGITNRPVGEEQRNQDALPERGESKPGAHAGHGDTSKSRSER